MRARGGYSLLEVLVAFAIMMLVLAALLPGQSRLAASSVQLRERQLANEYALSLLALASREGTLTPGSDGGTYQERWDWRIEIAANPATQAEWPLFDITVRVATLGGEVLSEVGAVRAGAP